MLRSARWVACPLAVWGLLPLAGCRADAPTTRPPSADTTVTVATGGSQDAGSTASAWTAGVVEVEPDERGASVLRAVRAAQHDGFERVVFEFSEGPVPGYRIAYVDRPARQCGSGEPVALAGDGWLEVRFSPARAHTEAGRPTITVRERTPSLPLLHEMKLTCDFEAVVTWVLGLATPNRFRAFTLDDPPRVVVDVQG